MHDPRTHLRFGTYLAPCMYAVYEWIARRMADRLGLSTELMIGTTYDRLGSECDVAFVCGLPYIEQADAIEPLVAPVLKGERYGGQPVYFSDVIVHHDSPFHTLADLRGRSWAFNEPHSQSGYGITRHHLLRLGTPQGFFGQVIEAGWHEQSIRLVLAGEVDGSAIDSQVLAVVLRNHPEYRESLRVIDSLGPSPIQPVTVARRLPADLKEQLRRAFLELHHDAQAPDHFDYGRIERFVPVSDADYDPIRAMQVAVDQADVRM